MTRDEVAKFDSRLHGVDGVDDGVALKEFDIGYSRISIEDSDDGGVSDDVLGKN